MKIKKVWNSLEITKLIVSTSIPLVVIIVGTILNRQIEEQLNQWEDQQ